MLSRQGWGKRWLEDGFWVHNGPVLPLSCSATSGNAWGQFPHAMEQEALCRGLGVLGWPRKLLSLFTRAKGAAEDWEAPVGLGIGISGWEQREKWGNATSWGEVTTAENGCSITGGKREARRHYAAVRAAGTWSQHHSALPPPANRVQGLGQPWGWTEAIPSWGC